MGHPASPVSGNGAGTPAIQLQGVTKVYGRGESAVVALRDINLTIAPGEYVAITGPSGSGKSTLMHLLGCLDRPTSGKILIEGQDVTRLSEARLAALRNRRIGFVFQSFHLMPRETVLRNVEWPLIYAGVPPSRRRERALEVLTQVGMAHRVRHRPQELSGGERQRVAIARALVNRPGLVLLDEPTGNLDHHTAQGIQELMRELSSASDTAFLVVTHDPELARQMDRILRLEDGKLVAA